MPYCRTENWNDRRIRPVPYSKQELLEARRQISSTLHKLEETVRTLEGEREPGAL